MGSIPVRVTRKSTCKCKCFFYPLIINDVSSYASKIQLNCTKLRYNYVKKCICIEAKNFNKAIIFILIITISLNILVSCSKNNTSTVENNDINYVHLSFDDVYYAFNNLATHNYDNLYNEPFFKWLKKLHDTYDAKFSLYVYNDTLTNVSNAYANQFLEANDWLKIGLHSQNANANYAESTYLQGQADWNAFVDNVIRITGSYLSVDRMPRLHMFAGNENVLRGMRDANYGALGFLSADDNRSSYYYTDDLVNYMYTNNHFTDNKNALIFLSTDIRVDWFLPDFTSNNTYKKPAKTTLYEELQYRYSNIEYANSMSSCIIFCHEWQLYNGKVIDNGVAKYFNEVCEFANDNNLHFDFPQNKPYNPTPYDIYPSASY